MVLTQILFIMAYFNNAFNKTFVVSSVDVAAGTGSGALAAGQLGLVDGADWQTVALPGGAGVPAVTAGDLAYVVQGSFYSKDTIGNNPGHGGYQESVKSKGINPRYITRLWAANCFDASQATAELCLASDCAPCGKTQFMRIDVKGSPALRFLNHNAYAIADSANVCCIDGQEYIDPALILATMMDMSLSDPLIKPFAAEGDVNGLLEGAGLTLAAGAGLTVGVKATSAVDAGGSAITASSRPGFVDAAIEVLTVSGAGAVESYDVAQAGSGYKVGDVVTLTDAGATTDSTLTVAAAGLTAGGIIVTETTAAGVVSNKVYTIAQAKGNGAGAYVPSTDPNGAVKVSACAKVVGAYVDTTFGNCSFDTRDHYNAEPVEIILSSLDETGNPCNDCGVASRTPGSMQQTQGEEVIRELILSERYRQSPYNQGNASSARIREIEMSDELLAAVDRTATYRAYYIQHSVPRFNNPTGVFDNDQYVYKIYAKCSDAADQAAIKKLMEGLEAWAADNGNKVVYTDEALQPYW
jgi:hypothetical protein|tara:strand:- start:1649 stop:3223 length:1575 start_codon:yes stop_codon:yes gene_type:complete